MVEPVHVTVPAADPVHAAPAHAAPVHVAPAPAAVASPAAVSASAAEKPVVVKASKGKHAKADKHAGIILISQSPTIHIDQRLSMLTL